MERWQHIEALYQQARDARGAEARERVLAGRGMTRRDRGRGLACSELH